MSITRSNLAASHLMMRGNLGAVANRHFRAAATGEPAITEGESAAVAVVDDDASVREAFTLQLKTAGFRTAAYASAQEFLRGEDVSEFACVVADIYLPGMNGLQLQHELNQTAPYASIVFVTGHGDLPVAMNAVRNGAVDFLEKPIDDEVLLSAVRIGTERSRARRREHTRRAGVKEAFGRLTARERDVFALITRGLLNKQVAVELGITERTVKAHRGRVMTKMSAGSLADLVRMAEMLRIHPIIAQHENSDQIT